jgi:hypothetical protein
VGPTVVLTTLSCKGDHWKHSGSLGLTTVSTGNTLHITWTLPQQTFTQVEPSEPLGALHYLDFAIPIPYLLPTTPMSAYSNNPSNESPASIPPTSPLLPIPFNLVQTIIAPQYPLLSPKTALNALTTQTDLNEMVCAITYGLISTVHN